jgi:hypothetical protein
MYIADGYNHRIRIATVPKCRTKDTYKYAGTVLTLSGVCCSGEITLDPTLTKVDDGAFMQCGITGSLTIPDSVTVIGNSAFAMTTLSGDVNIGNGVQVVGVWAFQQCQYLSGSLTLGTGLIAVYNYAFEVCAGIYGGGDEVSMIPCR